MSFWTGYRNLLEEYFIKTKTLIHYSKNGKHGCEFVTHLRLFSWEENCSMKVPLSSSLCFTFVFRTPGSHWERGHGLWPLGPGKAWPLGPTNGKRSFPTSTNQAKVGLRPRLSCKLAKPSFKALFKNIEEFAQLQKRKFPRKVFLQQEKAISRSIRMNSLTLFQRFVFLNFCHMQQLWFQKYKKGSFSKCGIVKHKLKVRNSSVCIDSNVYFR